MTTPIVNTAGKELSHEANQFFDVWEDGTQHEIMMPLYHAPNVGDGGGELYAAPHIVRDSGEVPYVMLEGPDGIDPARERVVKVARLDGRNTYGRFDLVLVLTDVAAYLMRGADFARQRWIDEIESQLAPADPVYSPD